MTQDSFRQFYTRELRKAYDAEIQMAKALPVIMEAASYPDLMRAFESHLEQTKDHVVRMEMIVRTGAEIAEPDKCSVVESLICELQRLTAEKLQSSALDLALIAYTQAMEHYEIARYCSLREYATSLGELDTATQLQNTLEEEQNFVRILSTMAPSLLATTVRAEETKPSSRPPSGKTGGELESAA